MNRSSGARIAHPKSARRNESQCLAPDSAALWFLRCAFAIITEVYVVLPQSSCFFCIFTSLSWSLYLYLEVLFPSYFTPQIPTFRCLGICHSSGALWSPTSSFSMLEPGRGRQDVCKEEHQTWRIELRSPRRYLWAMGSGTGHTAWALPVDLTNFLSRFLQVLNVLVTHWKDLLTVTFYNM